VLVSDPPYVTVNRTGGAGHLADWFTGGLSWPEIGRVLRLARRKLKPSGLIFLMANGDGLEGALAALRSAGFSGIRTITWDRRWPGLGGGLRHRTEFILLGRLPGSRPIRGVDLLAVPAVGPGTADRYPTEKPVGLGRAIARIAEIGPNDLVVDPFCGSGALLVGPAERGATVIGGDIAARAVRRAAGRLQAPAGADRKRRAAGATSQPQKGSGRTHPALHPPAPTTRRPRAGSRVVTARTRPEKQR
jgi:SAM-dependent methyltransferase